MMRLERRLRSTSLALATCSTVALLGIPPTTALAGEFSDRGPYVAVSGVYANDLFQDELRELAGIEMIPGDVSLTDSGGVNARIGYRAFSWLAAEVQYEWVSGIGIEVNSFRVGEFRPQSVTGNLKWILPIGRFQPYALTGFGVAFWEVEAVGVTESGTGFAARLGVGSDIYITKNLALTVEAAGVLNTQEFEFTNSNLDKLYYFSTSAGLLVHF